LPAKVDFINKMLARIDRLDRGSVQSYITNLVREKETAERILNEINEGVLTLDSQGTVKSANHRAHLWLGFERFFKDRSKITELVNDPLIRQFIFEQLDQPEISRSQEFDVLTPREMSLRLHWIPFNWEDEKRILIRIENITEEGARGKEEDQIKRIEGLLRLAAGVAHEIGNPLNSIQIHIGLLKQEAAKLPKTKQKPIIKLADVLSSETKRLDQIVRSFLRTSRRSPVRFRKESLNEVLEEAVKFLQPEIRKRKVRLDLSFDKNLPDFLMDRDRLHQAFINLIKNAIEAMPEGGALTISTGFKEKLCLVRFEDEGMGIEEKDMPHIFETYFTTKEEGSGLGLAQVYQTVREHGGRIDVRSRREKGTVFTLILPVRQERLFLPQPVSRKDKR